jgi:hypothetical protein
MHKWLTAVIFIFTAPMAFILIFYSAQYLSPDKLNHSLAFEPNVAGYRLFLSVPNSDNSDSLGMASHASDARSALLKKFFKKYKSPLEPLSEYIVYQADNYGIDYRLIPAIAMQESTGCKFIPEESFNCWGYGIYGDKVLRFESYEHGVERVTSGLKKNYVDKGLTSPQAIMHKYTPPSIALGGPWASGVEFFFDQIENPSE